MNTEQLESLLASQTVISKEYMVFKYDRPQDGMTQTRVTLYPLKEFEAPTTGEAIALAAAYVQSLVAPAVPAEPSA